MHVCKNTKYCPICSKKLKTSVVTFFQENKFILFRTTFIADYFKITYGQARAILKTLENNGVIIQFYSNQKQRKGKGIDSYFTFNFFDNNINYKKLIQFYGKKEN